MFYAGVVIPIGTSELGSTTQGFVTRRVTSVLNISVAISCGLAALETAIGWRRRSRRANRLLVAALAVIALTCLLLFGLHAQLQQLLGEATMSVRGGSEFYQRHRIYLWLSTVQWLSSLLMIWIFLNDSPTAAQQP